MKTQAAQLAATLAMLRVAGLGILQKMADHIPQGVKTRPRSRPGHFGISPRHKQYLDDDRARVRASLAKQGLSNNVNDWPKGAG